ncbi:MAG: hypothetical protein IJ706_06505 [Clostridia bacterium]|nr:hypothetical protein [Clostridia bacterium]
MPYCLYRKSLIYLFSSSISTSPSVPWKVIFLPDNDEGVGTLLLQKFIGSQKTVFL